MNIQELLALIGQQTVELVMLRQRVQQLEQDKVAPQQQLATKPADVVNS
jgi:hypothetical protein